MSNRARDVAYGAHSKIPVCCIAFYVDQWSSDLWKDSAYNNVVHAANWGYIPCPKCFYTNNKVRIVDCVVDCGRECWREF